MSATILVADDDRAIRMVLNQALTRLGHDVRMTGNAATLWRWVADGEGDLVITDVIMPDENGLDLIPRIKRVRPDLRVIVMSAQNTLLTAVKATERGAFEYLPKPFDLRELVSVVERALSAPQERRCADAEEEAEEQLPLIGRSPAMQEIYRVDRPADGHRPDGHDHRRKRHRQGAGGPRAARFRQAPLRAVCRDQHGRDPARADRERAVRPREGGLHRRDGARRSDASSRPRAARCFSTRSATCRSKRRPGCCACCRRANITAVGGRAPIRVDVRIIAATHRDLPQLIRQGLFREDLFYRLNVAPIRLPPLRERSADIPALVRHFASLAAREGLPLKRLDDAAMERLRRYRWPGNVRELENLVRRLAALYSQEVIGVEIIEAELGDAPATADPAEGPSGEGLAAAVERHINDYFAAHKAPCRPPASTTGCCAKSSGR